MRTLADIKTDRAAIEAEINAAYPNIPQDLQARHAAILAEHFDYVEPALQAWMDANIPGPKAPAAAPAIAPVKVADVFGRPLRARFAGADAVTGRSFLPGEQVWACLFVGASGIANETRGYVTATTVEMVDASRDLSEGRWVTPVKGNAAAIRELLTSAPADTQIRVRWATSEILYRRVDGGWRRQGRNGTVSVAQLAAMVEGALFIRATARDGRVVA